MTSVAEILKAKGNPMVQSVAPTVTVRQALQFMADQSIGAVLVMDGNTLMGIFTERDYARKIALQGRASIDTLISDVMTAKVVFVKPDHRTDECMSLMTQRRLRHLPVVDADKVVGLVSIGDLVKNIIAEQQFTITQMEQYITGQR